MFLQNTWPQQTPLHFSTFSRVTLVPTGSCKMFHHLSKPFLFSVNGTTILPNSESKNSEFLFLNSECLFLLSPQSSHIIGHQTCWVSPQMVFWFCQVLFPCTVPVAQNLAIYTPAYLFSPDPQFIHLQHFYHTIMRMIFVKCRADQTISHFQNCLKQHMGFLQTAK